MKILVVEDDEAKRVQLGQFLRREFPDMDIHEERSLQSGLRYVRQNRLDLVLLDMTLPTYDAGPGESGGETHVFGGREFRRQLDRFDISVPVIVVTQFETFGQGTRTIELSKLDQALREEHGSQYRGSVYYHAAIHGWEEELKSLILAARLPTR